VGPAKTLSASRKSRPRCSRVLRGLRDQSGSPCRVAGAELPTGPANLDRHSQRERDAQRASATPCHTPPQQAGPHKESRPGSPHAPNPLPHLRAPAALHRPPDPGGGGRGGRNPVRYTTERVKRMVGAYGLVGDVAAGFCAGAAFSKRSTRAGRQRAGRAAAGVSPAPQCFPRAAKRNGNQPHLSRNEVDHHIATERIGVAAKG
jgi:hypothetical protein